ncbi:VOC family protein [uncultured Mycolicibacterium sp.]|jgi:Glyoxalase/Bleomycin resistance protein/Dioxygenase superfamily.|uniref:VOC family protein n=1 Tax=uncultured Mycolicibacterium sp. TaxID=2320817 RepID=UPI0026034428|nr:VOC family protein [uncultured Mycolicibacterium sp.]
MAGLRIENITVDSTDPGALARWWAERLGVEAVELVPGAFLTVPLGAARLAFQRVEHPTPGKNRLHLDFRADDLEAAVAGLTAAGATELGRHAYGDLHWVVLADPDGNQFCVSG